MRWWLESTSVLAPNVRSHYALWPAMVRNNAIHLSVIIRCCDLVWSQEKHCSLSYARCLLSHRAPVRGTLPCTDPCLPPRISQTRMITVLNLGRHLRHPGTLYPGTCQDMSDLRGKSKEDPCWIRQRELCSGSQVRVTLSLCCNKENKDHTCSDVLSIWRLHEPVYGHLLWLFPVLFQGLQWQSVGVHVVVFLSALVVNLCLKRAVFIRVNFKNAHYIHIFLIQSESFYCYINYLLI